MYIGITWILELHVFSTFVSKRGNTFRSIDEEIRSFCVFSLANILYPHHHPSHGLLFLLIAFIHLFYPTSNFQTHCVHFVHLSAMCISIMVSHGVIISLPYRSQQVQPILWRLKPHLVVLWWCVQHMVDDIFTK